MILNLLQTETEFDPAETYNFLLVMLGIILLIIILAYILLTSREE